MPRNYRTDELGEHRAALDRNRKKIYATQTICGICGKPVDFSLRYPNPMSKTIDHIIPAKSDGLLKEGKTEKPEIITNRNLPQSRDWSKFKTV